VDYSPDGHSDMKCLVEGPDPSTGTCGISAPTLPGPSGCQRALATPERHGWLNALKHDFKRPDGSEGFTAKRLATSFTGVGIDQTSVPDEIWLDMRGCATDIVKKYGFVDA
jgi:hypothetical protein